MNPPKSPRRILQITLLYSFAVLFLFFTGGISARAQEFHFPAEVYTIDDGLSHNTIQSVTKDSCGFIWVSTSNGINRFDGIQFKQYKLDFTYYSAIFALDMKGELWIHVPTVTSLRYDFEQDSLHFPYAHICERGYPFRERNGDLWMYVGDTLFQMGERSDGSAYVLSALNSQEEIGGIYWMFDVMDGGPFIHHPSGIYRANKGKDGIQFSEYELEVDGNMLSAPPVARIIPSGDSIWILSEFRLIRSGLPVPGEDRVFRGEFVRMEDSSINLRKDDMVLAIEWDGQEFLYFRTLNGVYRRSVKTGHIEWIYQEDYAFFDVTEGKFQEVMFYDSDGILWLGTDKGLVKIVLKQKDFHWIGPDLPLQEGLLRPEMGSVMVDRNDQLWIGGGGLYRSRPDKDGQYRSFDHYLPDPGDPYSLYGTGIPALFEDSRGEIYISAVRATEQSQVQIIREPMEDRLKFHSVMPGFADQIREDHQGLIYMSRLTDVSDVYDPDSDSAFRFCLNKNRVFYNGGKLYSRNDQYSYFMTEDSIVQFSGPMLYGTKDGSTYAYPEKTSLLIDSLVKNYRRPDSTHLYSGRFIVSGEEGNEEFWVSVGNRIRHYKGDKLLNNYDIDKGLSDDKLYEVLEDGRNRIWVSSAKGLNCINPKNGMINGYFVEDGLPSNKFNFGSFKDRYGRLYFCTTEGVVWFHPDSIAPGSMPRVYLTNLKLFNESVNIGPESPLKKQLMFTDQIKLPYDQNFISLEYAALDYSGTERIKYRYMMEGLDQSWVDAGKRRMADYPGLKPGRYTFRVIACNSNGVWNEEGASIGIIISPPPWFRWWAFLSEGFLLLLLIIMIIRIRERNLKARAIMLERRVDEQTRKILDQRKELDDMKTRFYTNISHEFRTPLTLILGPMEDALKKKSRLIEFERGIIEMVSRNARRLQRLINQLLDISKLESGEMKVRVQKCDLTRMSRTIAGSFMSLAESRKIQFRIDLQETDQEIFTDLDKIEKILVNLLSNAFKYTSAGGEVIFRMKYEFQNGASIPQTVVFTVEDTGRGIPPEQISKIFDRFYHVTEKVSGEDDSIGIGLSLSKELADLLGGRIEVLSEVGSGSIFTFSLPVSAEHFSSDGTESKGEIQTMIYDHRDREEVVSEGAPGKVPADKNKVRPEVLVVEDNPDLRSYIVQQLREDFRIREAEDGRKGLDLAQVHVPDLIISDLMMPVMDGMEMCSLLKEDDRTSHIPLIMLTARADKNSKMEGLESGADDYLIKPFDADELRARVHNLVKQREKLREIFRRDLITEPREADMLSPQDKLLLKILKIIKENLSDPDFHIEKLTEELSISKAQLYRKVDALTGFTPGELLRIIRLNTAASMFKQGHKNVFQVMLSVGLNNQSNFARIFKKQFNLNPAEFIKSV